MSDLDDLDEHIDTWLLGRFLAREDRRDLESELFNWTNALVKNYRARSYDWLTASRTLTQIAALVSVTRARALELHDLRMAQLDAWQDMYGGNQDSPNVAYDRLRRINAR